MPKARPARRPETKRRGDIAEIAFLQRATNQGLRVSKPYGDSDRYDFIIDNGTHRLRIQVKSTGKLIAKDKYHVNAGRRLGLSAVPYLKSEIDFLAVHIHPENTWYIIPMSAIDGRVSLSLSSPNDPQNGTYGEYCEAWHLLKQDRRTTNRRTHGLEASEGRADQSSAALSQRKGKRLP